MSDWSLPHELHDPVCFPGLSAVPRERLLTARAAALVCVPNEANDDRLSVQTVIGKESTDLIGKISDDWHVKIVGGATVKPPDGPLPRRRIEGAEGCGLDLAIGKV